MENSLTIEEWNAFIGEQYNAPLSALSLKIAHFDPQYLPQLYNNSTLYTNCNRQHSLAFNPSHLLMNTGFLYELSLCILDNLGRRRIFKYDIQLPFKQFFMHQCPNTVEIDATWEWGKSTMRMIVSKLYESRLIKSNYTTIFRRGKESNQNELICFNDLYVSSRSSHWIEGFNNAIYFRKEIAKRTGEPKQALEISERSVDYSSSYMRQSYCTIGGSKPTTARIYIYQRSENFYPRTIVNMEELKAALQKYTEIPIKTITTTQYQKIQEQILLFNEFDILVTIHGSHMTNGVFTMHPYNRAVIELVPFAYESTFYRNYVYDLGFAEYIISTGHLTPRGSNMSGFINASGVLVPTKEPFCAFKEYNDFYDRQCKIIEVTNPPKLTQSWWTCDASLHSKSCDMWINISSLEQDVNSLIFKSLCET